MWRLKNKQAMEMEVKDGKTMKGKIAVERRHQG